MDGYDKHYEVSLFLDNALYSDYYLNKLCSSSDTSILCIPTVCSHSLGQRSFSYTALAVWNTMKSGHPTPSHPSHHQFKLIFFSSPTDCVCVWGGREWGGGEREKLVVYPKVWSFCVCFFLFPTYFVSYDRPCAQKRTHYYYYILSQMIIQVQSTTYRQVLPETKLLVCEMCRWYKSDSSPNKV